jgi:hypothetical protein
MDLQCKFIGNAMESAWTSPWNPYGMHHSMELPYGFLRAHGMKKWLGCQPKNSPWNSMEWGWNPPIPYGK